MKGWPDESPPLRSMAAAIPGAATGTRASAPTNTEENEAGSSRTGVAGWLWARTNWACPSPIRRSQPARLSEASWTGPRLSGPPIATIHSEKKVSDSEWVAAMRSGSTGAGNAARASVRASSTWRRSVSAQGSNRRPASVSVTARGPRSNSRAPVHCSNARMRRLKAGCVMCRRAAAREKLRLSVRATKSASQFKSKPVQVHVVFGIGR